MIYCTNYETLHPWTFTYLLFPQVSRAEDAEQACSVRSTSTSRQHDLLLTGTQSGAASLIQVPRMQLQTSLQRCAELPGVSHPAVQSCTAAACTSWHMPGS